MNERSAVQSIASWTGTAFLVLGILGFIPGVTDGYGTLLFAGHHAGAQLFSVFDVSVLLNLVHVGLGVAGLWLARTRNGARAYLIGAGAGCLGLWIYGLAVSQDARANFLPTDAADDWLHFAAGAVLLGSGLLLGRRPTASATAATQ